MLAPALCTITLAAMEAAGSKNPGKRASGWKKAGKFEGCNEKRAARHAARRAACLQSYVDKAVTDLQTMLSEAKESEKSLKRDLQQLEAENKA